MPNEESNRDKGNVTRRPFSRTLTPKNADAVRGFTSPYTVTNISREILPANPQRKLFLIQNTNTVGNIWIAFGANATVGGGYKVAANGAGLLLDIHTPTASVSAIGDIAVNSNISISVA